MIGPFAARVLRQRMINSKLAMKVGRLYGQAYEGSDAFRRGESPVDCPYVLDTDEWHNWLAGWYSQYDRRFSRG
jgi:ribosome modulation factor